jgi:sugar O-acyltransferase (sialic acid O-acetyltransferase NeuD family)
MILYGASGHAKVICSSLESENIQIEGIFEDNPDVIDLNKYQIFGGYKEDIMINSKLIISIGNNQIRNEISKKINHDFGITIHKSSLFDRTSKVGEGSVILHNTVVQRDTCVGNHVIVNTNSSIDHDCKIGNFVHISPNACICGNVVIGEGTHIGAGAIVIQGIKIGKWVTVGAGSVIINHIPDYATVVGNPGRIIKENKINE